MILFFALVLSQMVVVSGQVTNIVSERFNFHTGTPISCKLTGS
jgi:hypothetical protein